jgi:glycosyltransferase involved in cell wall biosynthesis
LRRVVLVFLGQRGGGWDILTEISSRLNELEIPYEIWLGNKSLSAKQFETGHEHITLFNIPHNFSDFRSINANIRFLLVPIQIFMKCRKLRNTDLYQIIPSPSDLLIDFALRMHPRKYQNRIIRLIHDEKSHLGEKWPTKLDIQIRVKMADINIFFSSYIKNHFNYLNNRNFLSYLPFYKKLFVMGEKYKQEICYDSEDISKEILFIGRIREYKGLDTLLAAFETLSSEYTLTIAGSGNLEINTSDSRIKIINEWLSEDTIVKLLINADLVVFPYIEASQSGFIPQAMLFNKKMIVSDLPGLVEQLHDYDKVKICIPGNVASLKNCILAGFKEPGQKYENRVREPKQDLVQIIAALRSETEVHG